MTDSPRRDGTEPTQPLGNSYPAYTDPAYASQAPYGPTYQAPAGPNPTQPLPQYSPYGYDPTPPGSTASSTRRVSRRNRRPSRRNRRAGSGGPRRWPC